MYRIFHQLADSEATMGSLLACGAENVLVFEQTEEMYNYCSNYEENQPLAKEEFPMIEDTKSCKYCNYKELCCRD